MNSKKQKKNIERTLNLDLKSDSDYSPTWRLEHNIR